MEDREFEELAKAMANGQPRRRIVKAIAGGALAGAAGLFTRSRTTVAAATTTTTTTKKPGVTTTTTTTKKPGVTTTTTTTKKPGVTTTTTTTKRPNNQVCYHSEGPNGGCKGACAAAGFTGRECNPICGSGQFRGYCPVGQGGGNPCCNAGLCVRANFVRVDGVVTYVGPTAGC